MKTDHTRDHHWTRLRASSLLALLVLLAACSEKSPTLGTTADTTTDSTTTSCTAAACAGASAPTWTLTDFQPQSAKFGQQYGLADFRGRALVVALLSGW